MNRALIRSQVLARFRSSISELDSLADLSVSDPTCVRGTEYERLTKAAASTLTEMSVEDQKKSLRALRAYAYHFDRYINELLRSGNLAVFGGWVKRHLMTHVNDLFADSHSILKDESYDVCMNLSDPWLDCLLKSLSSERLLQCILHYVREEMYPGLLVLRQPVPQKLTLFRAVVLDELQELKLELRGLSSTTVCFGDAVDIAVNSQYPFPLHEKYVIVLQFEIETSDPIAIPMSLCTIQEENEVVIAAEVQLEELSRENKVDYIYQNKFMSRRSDGSVGRRNRGELYTYDDNQSKRGIDVRHCKVESVSPLSETMSVHDVTSHST